MKYLLIAVLAVSFLLSASIQAWQATCEDDIHCSSTWEHRRDMARQRDAWNENILRSQEALRDELQWRQERNHADREYMRDRYGFDPW